MYLRMTWKQTIRFTRPLRCIPTATHVEQANSCGNVVLVVFDWLLSRFTNGLECSDMDYAPDWVAFFLVVLEDGLNVGSILQVTWEDFDDGILPVLLGRALGKLVEGNFRDSCEGSGVRITEADRGVK